MKFAWSESISKTAIGHEINNRNQEGDAKEANEEQDSVELEVVLDGVLSQNVERAFGRF